MGVVNQALEREIEAAYLDYAMSVIVGRAIPDVNDGLKPVQRRIIYAMYEIGNTSNKPYKKSARVVGEVLGKYHPHGDSAIYDALVRMAQPFSMRYPLIDGQGNFGSIDGDGPAAMRYTEVRLSKISEEFVKDIEEETVAFVSNFDATLKEPVVLPTRFPNLIVNASVGIAVGMATNVAPHNLSETVDALIAMLEGREVTIKGPDFPTGGQMFVQDLEGYVDKKKGSVRIRAVADVNEEKGEIRIKEIPYQTSKAEIIEQIAQLNKNKQLGITTLQDRSDKKGLEIYIKVKKGVSASNVLSFLFKNTHLEKRFNFINLALVDGVPKLLTLREMLSLFLKFRKDVVRKRTRYKLKKAQERIHLLLGLKVALDNIDEVVRTIKAAPDTEHANKALQALLNIDELQAKAILDMKLQRLTNLEQEKLQKEIEELKARIAYYKQILENEDVLKQVVKEELVEIKEKFGDARKTRIVEFYQQGEDKRAVLITVDKHNFVKAVLLHTLRKQTRGGKGLQIGEVEVSEVAHRNECVALLTNTGRLFSLCLSQVPITERTARGKVLTNYVNLEEGEYVVDVKRMTGPYLLLITADGKIKKMEMKVFKRMGRSGIKTGVQARVMLFAQPSQDVIIVTKKGQAIRFNVDEIRTMGKAAGGVKAITLKEDEVVDACVVLKNVVVITNTGVIKRVDSGEIKRYHRGGSGVRLIKLNAGEEVAKVACVEQAQHVLIVTNSYVIRFNYDEVSVLSRNARGVKAITLERGELIKRLHLI